MVVTLDGRGPKYAQIARALVALIRRGVLAPGSRAPSSRELAQDLGCSRNLVLLAYEQLSLEGYLVGRERTGTFVAAGLGPEGESDRHHGGHGATPRSRAVEARAMRLSSHGRRLTDAAAEAMVPIQHQPPCAIDFMYGISEPDERLNRGLRAAMSASLERDAFRPAGAHGDPELREQIARRLRAARAIVRTAGEIVITTGTQQAVDLCARVLLSPGDRVAFEEPGYAFARAVFAGAGARVLPVRVDADGLDPADLAVGARAPRLVYVTPSHQFPTGVVMTAARRQSLVAWAHRTGALIVEDDYDGEFRYSGQPVPALAGLDPDAVIYCGTFTKSLFTTCRVGYLVLPPALVEPFVRAKWLADLATPRILQRALARLISSGEFDRHVRRKQRRYRERRDALVTALRDRLGDEIEIQGASAGLHLAVWLPRLPVERVDALVSACRGRGVGIYPMARHAHRPLSRAALLLGYGLVEVERIGKGVRVLAEEYRRLCASRRADRGRPSQPDTGPAGL